MNGATLIKEKHYLGGLQFKGLVQYHHGTWPRTGRHGAIEEAENSVFGLQATRSELRHWGYLDHIRSHMLLYHIPPVTQILHQGYTYSNKPHLY